MSEDKETQASRQQEENRRNAIAKRKAEETAAKRAREEEVQARLEKGSDSMEKLPSGKPVVMKGTQEFRHDLYKTSVEKMLKRKPSVVTRAIRTRDDLWEIKHSHTWHNRTSSGRALTHTNWVGGHCHEVLFDENGDPYLGPPLTERQSKPGTRAKPSKRKLVPIQYFDHVNPSEADESWTDDHTHEMIYIESELINPRQRSNVSPAHAAYLQRRMNREEQQETLRSHGITMREG